MLSKISNFATTQVDMTISGGNIWKNEKIWVSLTNLLLFRMRNHLFYGSMHEADWADHRTTASEEGIKPPFWSMTKISQFSPLFLSYIV